MKPQADSTSTAINKDAILCTVEAAWNPLMRFLYELQKSPQGLRIHKSILNVKPTPTLLQLNFGFNVLSTT
jgi:hypothetical protein